MKKISILLAAILVTITSVLSACSSDKKENKPTETSKTNNSTSSKKISLPDPCTVVDFADIQAVMQLSITSERGEQGKFYDGGSTKYCSWEAKESPYSSVEIRLGKNGNGSNNLETAKDVAGPEGFAFELGDKAVVDTKRNVISFVYKDVYYDVQVVQNEKDFSTFSKIPPELKISGSSIAGSSIQSNLIAEYLIATKIIENTK
ncbi:MAG: hypothetical protein U0R17_03690 [Acidimicrobiia bacterium]